MSAARQITPSPEVRRRPEREPVGPLPDDLLSVPAAARRVGMHPESLYRIIRQGDFPPAVHIGGKIRVSVPRLERYLHGEAS